MRQKFTVTGMTCSACALHVERAVSKLDGVRQAQVNLMTNSMTAEYDEAKLGAEEIAAAVESAGYHASAAGEQKRSGEDPQAEIKTQLHHMKHRLIVSFVFLIPLFYLSMGHMLGLPIPAFFHGQEHALPFAMTQFLLVLPIIYWNDAYYKVGFRSLFKGAPNMDSLVAIGSAAALVYGVVTLYQMCFSAGQGDLSRVQQLAMDLYFESAGMILTLVTLGKYLETRAKGKTSEAIYRLMDLVPQTAVVLREDGEQEIPVEQVQQGDLLILRSGQSVPVDGIIEEGSTAVDESALTGESMPVEKTVGDPVYAATVNQSGFLKFRATKVGSETVLSQIIRLVEEAGASKAPIAKLADRVAGVFVPVVIGIAVLAAAVWLIVGQPVSFALSIGIAVLVISCPCALGLATPVAIMVGTGKGAEHEILIKSAEALETLYQVKTVVLDKTGTITEGKPRVTDLAPAEGITEEQLLQLAASMEGPSEHPLARAICEQAAAQALELVPTAAFTAEPGRGIQVQLGEIPCLAGNALLMKEQSVGLKETVQQQAKDWEAEGKTVLYFAGSGRFLGAIALADVVKESSRAAIAQLRQMGMNVVMLTGDNRRTAQAIGRTLPVTDVIAEVLPQDKERVVSGFQIQGKKVAMVGDGINDAPALTRADVGLAIGAGTDVAMESADLVLMRSDLQDVAGAVRLSKAVIKNVKENLFWAFFYNCIGIPLAAGVLYPLLGITLNPMIAAAAMSLSSVCVVSNALRLKLFRFDKMDAGSPKPVALWQAPDSDFPLEQGAPVKLDVPEELASIKESEEPETPKQDKASEPETEQPSPAEPEEAELEPSEQSPEEPERAARQAAEPEQAEPEKSKQDAGEIPQQEGESMEKQLKIEGMSCKHCSARVEKVLGELEGVSKAVVDLEAKSALVSLSQPVTDAALQKAVEDAGYEVVEIQ